VSKTKENLENALVGEAKVYVRYLAFPEKADEEGYSGVARLFRAVSRSEMVHAQSHQRALGSKIEVIEVIDDLKSPEKGKEAIEKLKSEGEIKTTPENLQTAIDGETYEFKKMYPAMIQASVEDKDIEARHSFEYAMSIEMLHAKFFKKAMSDLYANSETVYYVCPVCGYTVADEPPKKCPYCGVDAKKFIEVN
jgi:rubrerythrin